MKALLLVGLALVLGAGALYLALDKGEGRGDRTPRIRAPAQSEPRIPAPEEEPSPLLPTAASRQSVEVGSAPTAHSLFEGSVIGDGAPIPGVSVAIVVQEQILAEGTTDERGRFHLESPPPMGGVLRLRARGFVMLERTLVSKPSGSTEKLGNIRLVRGRRISGRVIDGFGKGIPDAELRATPMSGGTDILLSHAHSGPDGNFAFADAPPGTALVRARAKGYGEREVPFTAKEESLVIQMEPGVELSLLLQSPRGEPVAGAEVTITAQGDARGAKRVATTDAEGRVTFEGLAAPVWAVRATHEDYRPAGRSQVQATGKLERLECLPWPRIEGRVVTPAGQAPPPGTRVQALPASAPSDRLGSMAGGKEVDAQGHFRLGGLRAGDWRVRAVAPGYAPALSGPIKLGIEGDGYAGNVVLDPGGKLLFQVLVADQPAKDAEVELFRTPPTPAQLWALASSRGAGLGQRVKCDSGGMARLENLAPGSVWVSVYAEGSPPASSGPHEANRDPAPIRIELVRGARVEGKVQDKSHAPIPAAQLRIVDLAGLLGFPITLACSPDGRYTSAWLPPGRYTIEAFTSADPNRRSGPTELVLKSAEQRTLDLTL